MLLPNRALGMEFKIFIDRLKDGHIEKFSKTIPASVFELKEDDLTFKEPIEIKGEAYLATDHLIVKLKAKTKISLPCSICNEPTLIPIEISDFYHAEPVAEIRGSVFDYLELLREDILIQVPQFTECHGGNCPERENLKKFMKKENTESSTQNKSNHHFPFSQL